MRPFIQFSSRNIQKSQNYYLSFQFKDLFFAVNFPEIIGFSRTYSFKPLHNFSNFILGIVEVHSELIPLINLSKKFGFNEGTYTEGERLMILEVNVFDNHVKFAIPYQQLGNALELSNKKMSPPPALGLLFEAGYVKGIYTQGNESIFVLDVKKLISIDDLIDLKIAPKKLTK